MARRMRFPFHSVETRRKRVSLTNSGNQVSPWVLTPRSTTVCPASSASVVPSTCSLPLTDGRAVSVVSALAASSRSGAAASEKAARTGRKSIRHKRRAIVFFIAAVRLRVLCKYSAGPEPRALFSPFTARERQILPVHDFLLLYAQTAKESNENAGISRACLAHPGTSQKRKRLSWPFFTIRRVLRTSPRRLHNRQNRRSTSRRNPPDG